MVFVGKNTVILGSEVRLVRQNKGNPIAFFRKMVFVGKNKANLGFEVRLVLQNKGNPVHFLLKHASCWLK